MQLSPLQLFKNGHFWHDGAKSEKSGRGVKSKASIRWETLKIDAGFPKMQKVPKLQKNALLKNVKNGPFWAFRHCW